MMKLMTLKQYMNMSKPALIRKITQTLRVMPKTKLARLCYNITKSKLPRLRYSMTGRQTGKKRFRPTELRRKGLKEQLRVLKAQPLRNLALEKDIRTTLSLRPIKRKTKRKFSRKQLAAQRLFAKRARAGTLRKRRRR